MQQEHYDRRDSETYRTGDTRPPKSKSGIIAVLLVLVILLSGIVSIMGIVNIKLLQHITSTDGTVPIAFSNTEVTAREQLGDVPGTASVAYSPLGLTGESVSSLYQAYYGLPQGLFVTAVEENSAAYRAGIRQGDILLEIDGRRITGSEDLSSLLSDLIPGTTLEITLFRVYQKSSGQQLTVTVTVDDSAQ